MRRAAASLLALAQRAGGALPGEAHSAAAAIGGASAHHARRHFNFIPYVIESTSRGGARRGGGCGRLCHCVCGATSWKNTWHQALSHHPPPACQGALGPCEDACTPATPLPLGARRARV